MKIQILVFRPRPPMDRINAVGRGNPDTMFPYRFHTAHTFDPDEIKQAPEDYAAEWIAENLPEYSGSYQLKKVLPGPGRRNKAVYHPENARGPRKIMEARI